MRKLLVAVACVGLMVTYANAQDLGLNDILLFFSTEGYAGAVPSDYGTTPSVNPGDTVHLWAKVMEDDVNKWQFIGVDFNLDVDAGTMYNPSWASGSFIRWNDSSDFDPTDERIGLAAVGSPKGLGGWFGVPGFDDPLGLQVMEGANSYVYYDLGELSFSEPGDVYMSMAPALIGKSGALEGEIFVYFGFGDASIPIYSTTAGVQSELPDLIVIPEPASLALLALAGLALRRR